MRLHNTKNKLSLPSSDLDVFLFETVVVTAVVDKYIFIYGIIFSSYFFFVPCAPYSHDPSKVNQ